MAPVTRGMKRKLKYDAEQQKAKQQRRGKKIIQYVCLDTTIEEMKTETEDPIDQSSGRQIHHKEEEQTAKNQPGCSHWSDLSQKTGSGAHFGFKRFEEPSLDTTEILLSDSDEEDFSDKLWKPTQTSTPCPTPLPKCIPVAQPRQNSNKLKKTLIWPRQKIVIAPSRKAKVSTGRRIKITKKDIILQERAKECRKRQKYFLKLKMQRRGRQFSVPPTSAKSSDTPALEISTNEVHNAGAHDVPATSVAPTSVTPTPAPLASSGAPSTPNYSDSLAQHSNTPVLQPSTNGVHNTGAHDVLGSGTSVPPAPVTPTTAPSTSSGAPANPPKSPVAPRSDTSVADDNTGAHDVLGSGTSVAEATVTPTIAPSASSASPVNPPNSPVAPPKRRSTQRRRVFLNKLKKLRDSKRRAKKLERCNKASSDESNIDRARQNFQAQSSTPVIREDERASETRRRKRNVRREKKKRRQERNMRRETEEQEERERQEYERQRNPNFIRVRDPIDQQHPVPLMSLRINNQAQVVRDARWELSGRDFLHAENAGMQQDWMPNYDHHRQRDFNFDNDHEGHYNYNHHRHHDNGSDYNRNSHNDYHGNNGYINCHNNGNIYNYHWHYHY